MAKPRRRLEVRQIASIKAAAMSGSYSVGEIATYHQVSKSTVQAIIDGAHSGVDPAETPPPIPRRRIPAAEVQADARLLRARGYTLAQVAGAIGVSESTVRRQLVAVR